MRVHRFDDGDLCIAGNDLEVFEAILETMEEKARSEVYKHNYKSGKKYLDLCLELKEVINESREEIGTVGNEEESSTLPVFA